MKHSKIYLYIRLMRLDKPIGIFLLLWPTLMALWIASNGQLPLGITSIFIVGVIVMRSAGCVINDLVDRHIDKAVSRTKTRPLAMGELTPKEAILLFLFLLIIAFALALQLNFLTIQWSVIALALTMLYPFMKRYTHFPQVILGSAWGFSVLMPFTVLTNHIPPEAILLYLATLFWTIAYDTEYAMVDRIEDIKIGVKSTAIWFGKTDRVMIGVFQLGVLGLLSKLGNDLGLGVIYFIGLFCAGLLILYQQYLIKDCDRERCFKAFLNNHWFGAVLFTALALDGCLSNF